MTVYIIENYSTGEFEAFEKLEQATTYVRKYYRDHMINWLSGSDRGVEDILQTIKIDLENLDTADPYPHIEGVMCIHDATLHD